MRAMLLLLLQLACVRRHAKELGDELALLHEVLRASNHG